MKKCDFPTFGTKILLLTAAVLLVPAAHAFAYLDPGSGSYFLQILLAMLLTIPFALRFLFVKLKDLFFKKKQDPPPRS